MKKLFKVLKFIIVIGLLPKMAEISGLLTFRNSSGWRGVGEFLIAVWNEERPISDLVTIVDFFILHLSAISIIKLILCFAGLILALCLLGKIKISWIKRVFSGAAALCKRLVGVYHGVCKILRNVPYVVTCLLRVVIPASCQNRTVVMWFRSEDITYIYGSAHSDVKPCIQKLGRIPFIGANGPTESVQLRFMPQLIFGANGQVYLTTAGKHIEDENGTLVSRLHVDTVPRTIVVSGLSVTIQTEGEM